MFADKLFLDLLSKIKHQAQVFGFLNKVLLYKFYCGHTVVMLVCISFLRTKAIDWILRSFLCHFNDVTAQVISLGAGYDSSCFRLLSEGAKSTFIEIDFPQTVQNKSSIVKSTPELYGLLQDPVFDEGSAIAPLRSKQYSLVGVDLCNVRLLEQTLSSLVSFVIPTLLLSECVMTYMDVKDSQRLIEWACRKFDNSMFVTYEQIHPSDGFGLVM